MFTLAPTAAATSAAAAGGNLMQRAMGDYYLKGWGAPGRRREGGLDAAFRITPSCAFVDK